MVSDARTRALFRQNAERLRQLFTKPSKRKAPGEGRRGPMAERGMKFSDFGADINTLTNWQRNQWARAGYPGLRQRVNSGPAMSFKLMDRHV